MDGFAYAGEALAGKYIGANFKKMIRLLFIWGIALSLAFTLLYGISGKDFLRLLTNDTSVIIASENYFYWALAIPAAGFSAFLWDGIFIGATATRQMLYAMLVSSTAFFLLYYSLYHTLGNHALWLAFILYLSLRGIMQSIIFYKTKFFPQVSKKG